VPSGVHTRLAHPLDGVLTVRVDSSWPHTRAWESSNAGNPEGNPIKQSFTFLDQFDSGFEEQAGTSYAVVDIVGRTEAYRTWTGNANRTIPIVFKMFVQGLDTSPSDVAGRIKAEVVGPARWLDATRYPVLVVGNRLVSPPPLLLQVGSLYFGRVQAEEVSIRWVPPFEPDTLLPHGADVSVTFVEINRSPGQYNRVDPSRSIPGGSPTALARAGSPIGVGGLAQLGAT